MVEAGENISGDLVGQGLPGFASSYGHGEAFGAEGPQRPDYGEKMQYIPEKYQRRWKDICTKIQTADLFARIEEVKRAADGGFYWRNIFDAYWSDLQFTWLQGSGPGAGDSGDGGSGSLSFPLNIYQAQGRAFMKIVGHKPNVHIVASGDSGTAYKIADGADHLLKQAEAINGNCIELSQDFARVAYTDGRYGIYTRWVSDGSRFGYYDDDNGDEEFPEGIGAGGNPPKKRPRLSKGGEVMSLIGVPWLKVPINMTSFHDYPWLMYSDECHISSVKALYPWIAEKIQAGEPGPAEFMFDRTTRIALTQGLHLVSQMAEAVDQLPTIQRIWVRPCMFAEIDDDEERQWFIDNYPNGGKVVFVGPEYAESCSESMDDHWSVGHAIRGHGQSTPAYGYSMLTAQDAFNDVFDLEMETHMRAIPAIHFDPSIFDLPAYSREQARPGAAYAMKHDLDPNINPSQHAFVEPQVQVSAQLIALRQWLTSEGLTAITGIAPAALGQSDENNQTLGGISILRAASRGEAGTAFQGWIACYSRACEQAIRLGARYRMAEADENGMLSIKRKGQMDVLVDLVELRMGNFWVETDSDQTYPSTFEEQQMSLTHMVLASAQGDKQAQEALANPANFDQLNKLRGIPNLKSLSAFTGMKVQNTIDRLMATTPQPNMQAVQMMQVQNAQRIAQGQPPVPPNKYALSTPSEMPGPLDNAPSEFAFFTQWVTSPAGQQNKQMSPDGFFNVELYAIHLQKMAQQAQDTASKRAIAPQLAIEAAKKQPAAKHPSESINFADLGPSGRIQLGLQAGLDLTADSASDMAEEALTPPQPRKLRRH